MKKALLRLSLLFLVLSCIASFLVWKNYQQFLESPLPTSQDIVFTIHKGETFHHILKRLKENNIIQQKEYFYVYNRLNKFTALYKAGEYDIPLKTTPSQLVEIFISGKVKQYSVTLPEGWTYLQIIEHLNTIDSLLKVQQFEQFIEDLGIKEKNPEGNFYPDTYFYTRGTSANEILKRSYIKMQYVLLKEWQQRELNLPITTPYQALILASIVEKESAKSSERDKIAGAFIRRLQKNMRLQSDPTIIYGMGTTYQGNIRKKDILQKTDYNTYQIDGLPPTPIASPGVDAIHAVLHPDKSSNLYFVADGSGGHTFSSTLVQHNKAVKRYLKLQKKY